MNKLKIASILSKIAMNGALAGAAVYRCCKDNSFKIVDKIKGSNRYDIEIYKGDDQLEVKTKLSKHQMLDIVNTMEVFPDISVIVKVHNKGYTVLNV